MRNRFNLIIGLAGLVTGLANGGWSFAASFDCGHAESPREKLICSDPTLSDLDRKLGHLYQERRALLSPHGAELLQISERSWLHYIATICPLVVADGAGRRRQRETCLQEEYTSRLGQLAAAGQMLGPYRFNRIDLFAAEPAPADDQTGATPGFYVQHVGYAQIDSPSSPQADAWNEQSVQELRTQDDCGQGDDDTEYIVGYAAKRFISAQRGSSVYCHGGAHGTFTSRTDNVVLLPKLRPATESDIFGPTDGWVEKLQHLVWDALSKTGWRPVNDPQGKAKSEMEDDVTQSDEWVFTAEGLEITFSRYLGGCYACNPPAVTVPWSVIRPLLPKDSVLN